MVKKEEIMFGLFRRRISVLFFCLCFCVTITTTYAYSNCEKYEVMNIVCEEFHSKLLDRSVDIKEVERVYKKYKLASRSFYKVQVLEFKKLFENFKKKWFKEISEKKRKDLEISYKTLIKTCKNLYRSSNNLACSEYKLAKVNRVHHKIDNPSVNLRVKKAEDHFIVVFKTFNIATEECLDALITLWEKMEVIKGEGYAITRLIRGNKRLVEFVNKVEAKRKMRHL
jgi:hypothetical protein